jgi:multiple sugar transport system ATP-binding protein
MGADQSLSLVPVFGAPERAATVGARTEHMRIRRATNGDAVGTVTWVEHLGDQNHLHVRIGETDLVTLSDPDSGLDHGDPVAIDFASPLFFDAAGVRIR